MTIRKNKTKSRTRKSSKRKSPIKKNKQCYKYLKTKSPMCNRYKDCIWVPKLGCRGTTDKKKVLNQIRTYEKQQYEKKQSIKKNKKKQLQLKQKSKQKNKQKNSQQKSKKKSKNKSKQKKKNQQKSKRKLSRRQRNVTVIKKTHPNTNMPHRYNKTDINTILMKHLPDSIDIPYGVKWNTMGHSKSIEHFNIPINKNLIQLDKARRIILLNKKTLQYFYSLVRYNNVEIGGELDFNLKDLFERSTSFLGKQTEIVIEIPDYEVPYHTHPYSILQNNPGLIFDPPSVGTPSATGDLYTYLFNTVSSSSKYLQQCNIVFSPDGVYVWYYSEQLYNIFKTYLHNRALFKKNFFELYHKHIDSKVHHGRLVNIAYNNYWMKHLENMGIYMFKYVDKQYTFGLDWNKHWNINDPQIVQSIQKFKTSTIPKIIKGHNIYPNKVPLFIHPVEPLLSLN